MGSRYTRGNFGDVLIAERHGTPEVIAAPPLTRIALFTLSGKSWPIRFDRDAGLLIIGEQVWYRAIELNGNGTELICEKIRDERPVTVQSADPSHISAPNGSDKTTASGRQ